MAGKLVVTVRGTCARMARAVFGQKAGAAAVLMVNNVNSLPPFEGPITGNPEHRRAVPGLDPVPRGAQQRRRGVPRGRRRAVTLTPNSLANPGFLAPASFTSGGPRTGDSWLKPDVTAPGVSIFSTGIGTGNSFAVNSGTSMAAPHTAGLAALVRQAHPSWNKVRYWKAAIVNTADPAQVNGYTTGVAGSGLVQAVGATQTNVVALGDTDTATLNYGFAELVGNYSQAKTITLRDFGATAATFNVANTRAAGSPHTVGLSRTTVTVPARGETTVRVTLDVPSGTDGTSAAFADVAGLVRFTPTGGGNNGVALDVPYYLVPQTISKISTSINTGALVRDGSATATVSNRNGATTGTADWYAWGLSDGTDRGFNIVPRNGTATENISFNAAEYALTPARGLLVISHDNASADEAQTIAVTVR